MIDSQALVYSTDAFGYYPSIMSDSQDCITSYNGYQYATYYDKDRHVVVARRPLSSNTWEVARLTDYTHTVTDTHNNPILGISPGNGRIHLAFDHHNSGLHYRVSSAGAATNPDSYTWSDSLFGSVTSILPGLIWAETNLTYPRFFNASNGDLKFARRDGVSGNGDWILYSYNSSTHVWTKNGVFADNEGTYEGSNDRNAYFDRFIYDSNGVLHTTLVWRETDNPITSHDYLYVYSEDDGVTWKNNAGTSFATTSSNPIDIYDTSAIIYGIGKLHGVLNTEYSTLDSSGRYHMIRTHMLPGEANASTWNDSVNKSETYHHWRDTSGTWHVTELPFKNYRANLVTDNDDNVYVMVGSDLQIWAATPASGYTDWSLIYTHGGSYHNCKAIDFERMKNNGIISVMVQETSSPGIPSSIRVIEFQPSYSGATPTPASTPTPTPTPSLLINDDFSDGDLTGWTMEDETGGTITIADFPSESNKSVKFNDTSTSNALLISQGFTAQTGMVTAEANLYKDSGEWNRMDLMSGSTVGVVVYMYQGYLKYNDRFRCKSKHLFGE